MKWQSELIIFVICLNLATGLVIELAVPGTEYVTPSNPSNSEDYEAHYNATEIAKGWTMPPSIGIPMIGDIWSGFGFLTRMITYTIVGFPLFLGWLGDSFITDASALAAWGFIKAVILAMFSVIIALFFIWFISGRDL